MDLPEALAQIELLLGQIAALEQQVAERDARLRDLTLEHQLRAFELAKLRRALFGDKSERHVPAQATLPNLVLDPSKDTQPAEPPSPKRRVREHERDATPRRRRARLELDPGCVTEREVHVYPSTTVCPCCGDPLTVMGDDPRVVVEREPARYTRTTTHRYRMACSGCKNAGVRTAPAEDPPASGPGTVGASLAVWRFRKLCGSRSGNSAGVRGVTSVAQGGVVGKVFGPQGGSIKAQQASAVEDAIDNGVREVIVVEDRSPVPRVLVRREEHRSLLDVPLVDDVEEHVGGFVAAGQVWGRGGGISPAPFPRPPAEPDVRKPPGKYVVAG